MAVKNYGIRDQWTNTDKLNNVDIKSVDGVIESVKINGEEAGGGGSSDFSTATLTVTNSGELMSEVTPSGVFLKETPNLLGNYIDTVGAVVEGGNTVAVTLLLYNGEVYIYIDAEEITSFNGDLVDMGDGKFKVNGDCSVTAKGWGMG